MITFTTELKRIRGLSATFLGKLDKLGIHTVRDLLLHFPTRYDDFSRVMPINNLSLHTSATVRGIVRAIKLRQTWRRRMAIVEAVITDDSGGIKAVWFNQPFIARVLREGMEANFAGKVASQDGELYLASPAYEPIREHAETKHTGGLIPIYPETKGLTSRGIRYLVKPLLRVLPPAPDFIPPDIQDTERIPEWNRALRNIHFPKTIAEADAARRRFAFENLYLLQLMNLRLRQTLAAKQAPVIRLAGEDLALMLQALPFKLTLPQRRTLEEILRDMGSGRPMNRLLQGDVGSGKTAVAALAALAAAHAGYQVAFMAPTEILARQHFATLNALFESLLQTWGIQRELLLGSTPGAAKRALSKKITAGAIHILIGTHALIEKNIHFKNLSLVVVDEQHRFGVEQRAALAGSAHHEAGTPHFLSMSATPIPRTLALTVFGDLDLSLIDVLPEGRKPIITKIVDPKNRNKAYAFMREKIKEGRQAFVICPRIEQTTNNKKIETEIESSVMRHQPLANTRWSETKTVTQEYEKLSKQIFPDLKVAMLHGKLKSKEKDAIMANLKNGGTDIVVATSVVEVGVDVPNASIMVIEGAEYFGLAQLYQFRGRIGRGEHQSYCLLFTESESQETNKRLEALLKAKNGFELAELDLAIRGPGEFLGDKQTGIPDLAMRSLTNIELIKSARDAAQRTLQKEPELAAFPLLKDQLQTFEHAVHLE